MGGPGSGGNRRQKPTALKKLEGNPGKRKLNQNEPQPDAGRPDMPAGLSGAARAEWKRVVPVLEQMGVLTSADGTALAAYCSSYALWMQAERHIAKFGAVFAIVDDETGQSLLKQNPSLRIRSDALRLMNTFMSKFGLDPKSRAGLVVNDGKSGFKPPAKTDALEQFLANARGADAGDEGKKPN